MPADAVVPIRAFGVPAKRGRARSLPPTDADALRHCLEAARFGDRYGFEAVYRALAPKLLRYATMLVGQDADDVAGEAWLQIIRDLRTFEGDWDAFRGWTARIVRNRALDHLRAVARRPVITTHLHLVDLRSGSDTTAEAAAEAFSTAEALEMIAALPRDQAEAVLLRAVVGLDAVTAAVVLGKKPGAVRVAAHRGLKALAKQLDDR